MYKIFFILGKHLDELWVYFKSGKGFCIQYFWTATLSENLYNAGNLY